MERGRTSPAIKAPSGQARQRGLVVLLVDNFLMWAGFFMVIPLVSVHYVDGFGWAAGTIGVVLGVRQLTQQGLTVVCGALADRWGAKWLICLGMAVRSVGFFQMAHADTLPLLFLSVILAATGGALFEAPKAASVAALTEPHNRSRFYALLGVTSGLGLAVGPFLGSLLLDAGFDRVAYSSAACYVATMTLTFFFLPAVRVAETDATPTAGLRLALGDRGFIRFLVLLMGYWFMGSQFSIAFPLVAVDIAGTNNAVSWVFGINAAMMILLQYPVMRLTERRLRPVMSLIVGMLTMASGLLVVGAAGAAGSLALLLGGVAWFSFGQLFASPSQQTVTANLANPAALGSYFGVASLSLALGGGIGNASGGTLYGLGERLSLPLLPWLSMAILGLGAAVGLARFARQVRAEHGGGSDDLLSAPAMTQQDLERGGDERLPVAQG